MEQNETPTTLPWTPIVTGALLILLVLGGAIFFLGVDGPSYVKNTEPTTLPTTPDTKPIVTTPNNPSIPKEEVRNPVVVTTNLSSLLGSPLKVKGEALGTWYFEASFPIHLKDGDGKVIATGIAQAETDWMTTDYVPFSATIYFTPPTETDAVLVFQKDNPSGLPEHDASFNASVKLLTAPKGQNDSTFYLAFISENAAANKDCTATLPTVRVLPKTTAIAKTAIEELLKGPTLAEVGDGMLTVIPDGVKLNSITIANGVATVDFSEALTKGVSGSCRVGAIRAEIEETLKQFPSVKDVVISVNGKSEDIMQP